MLYSAAFDGLKWPFRWSKAPLSFCHFAPVEMAAIVRGVRRVMLARMKRAGLRMQNQSF